MLQSLDQHQILPWLKLENNSNKQRLVNTQSLSCLIQLANQATVADFRQGFAKLKNDLACPLIKQLCQPVAEFDLEVFYQNCQIPRVEFSQLISLIYWGEASNFISQSSSTDSTCKKITEVITLIYQKLLPPFYDTTLLKQSLTELENFNRNLKKLRLHFASDGAVKNNYFSAAKPETARVSTNSITPNEQKVPTTDWEKFKSYYPEYSCLNQANQYNNELKNCKDMTPNAIRGELCNRLGLAKNLAPFNKKGQLNPRFKEKIINHLYLAQKTFKANASSRIIEAKAHKLVYFSKNGDRTINLNCVASNKEGSSIACRQLAFEQLRRAKQYHHDFSSQEKLKLISELDENLYDNKQIERTASSYHICDLEQIGSCLAEICAKLALGAEKKFLLYTENHVLSKIVKNKSNGFIINFYEPNMTLAHRRIIISDLCSLSSLTINDYLSSTAQQAFLPNLKSITLLGYDNPDYPQKVLDYQSSPKLDYKYSTNEAANIFFGLIFNDPQIISLAANCTAEVFGAKNSDGIPGLYFAFQNGNSLAVAAYTQKVLKSEHLTSQQKFQLLSAMTSSGHSGLMCAFKNGQTETIAVFIQLILAADTTSDDFEITREHQLKLIQGLDRLGNSALDGGFQGGQSDAVIAFMEKVLTATNLSRAERYLLLEAKNAKGTPGLFMAFQAGHSATVMAFCLRILQAGNDKLSTKQKFKLLTAKRANATSGLFMAFQNQSSELILKFIDLVLKNEELSSAQKISLIQGYRSNGKSGLVYAIDKGYYELATSLVNLISKSNKLTETEKLAAIDSEVLAELELLA